MEELLKWAFYVITAIIGWFVKTLWDAVSSLRQDLKILEVKLPENYVTKEDFKHMYETVILKLDRIENLFYNHINDAFRNRMDK